MIESLGALFRFLQLAANMILIGGCVFLAITARTLPLSGITWLIRLKRSFPWLGSILVIGLLGLLATTTAQATGVEHNVWSPAAWVEFIQKTRIGFIWMLRESSALVVFGLACYVGISSGSRWQYWICASAASLTLVIGSIASHPAAEEQSIIAVFPYALHLILASVWFGGLPAVVALLCTGARHNGGFAPDQSTIRALKRFSTMALPVMVVVVATGLLVADRMVGTNYAALFATEYGWLLNAKLGLLACILVIAGRAHFVWLPTMSRVVREDEPHGKMLRQWLPIEFILASLLVLVATLLANAVPAKHETIDNWPFPFRFSIVATWDDWLVRTLVLSGISLLFVSAALVFLGRANRWGKVWRIVLPSFLFVFSTVLIVYPLAIQSYPETYRKTPVPFDSISIANGMTIFSANCVPCHGPQAKGNGVLAKSLPRQPIDFLTEPHTAMHTAGDFFHWLTYGRFDGIMPPFGDKLSEEERWDVLNFLHANSRGYQARIITPRILPEQPFMVSPNFSYTANDGSSGTLKDFRPRTAVLLVLFSWPESRDRLLQLKESYSELKAHNTVVLAVPENDSAVDNLDEYLKDFPFPVVTQGASEITRSYSLFRRTIAKPDLFGEGSLPKHMEFLFDRFGYLRGRWIPEGHTESWSEVSLLIQQIDQLSREGELRPPPDDHVH